MRRRLIVMALVVLAAAAGGAWWYAQRNGATPELALSGNVDLRQVSLAFNGNDRIAAVLVEEGDRVTKGQILAHLDTSRLEPQVAQAEAQVAAQRAAVERLRNGSRPEEIAQARANLGSAKADALNARKQYERKKSLLDKNAGSQQDADTAKAVADVADARVEVNQKALDLSIAGPRSEDIAQAEAQLRGNEAQLAYLRQQLADAELKAPVDGVVRSRLMEPGEMASPQRPVFSLAIIDPKWVRAYVSERNLGKVRSGMQASVAVDSFPGRRFDGWVGFMSPVAEFTPKSGGDHRAAHQPGLRDPGVREGSAERPAARHAGDGASAVRRQSGGARRLPVRAGAGGGRPAMNADAAPPLVGRDIRKTFRRGTGEVVHALDGVSLDAAAGTLTALVGPDGAGKTTLIRLAAGLLAPDSGELRSLGIDVTAAAAGGAGPHRLHAAAFGLYEDLSVQENLDLYADLHGIGAAERAAAISATDGDDGARAVHATAWRAGCRAA